MTAVVSKPDRGAPIVQDGVASEYLQTFFDDLQNAANGNPQINLASYTVAAPGLPDVTTTPGLIFVSDESGGSVPAFSDGTNWRRVTDRAIVT